MSHLAKNDSAENSFAHTCQAKEFLPLSAIWHFAYCPRRFYLIFVQGEWKENFFVADGFWKHRNVHRHSGTIPKEIEEISPKIKKITSVWVESHSLCLRGIVDVAEIFFPDENKKEYEIILIEFKRGGRKPAKAVFFSDAVLTTAQAISFSESVGVEVKKAKVFYFSSRRRFEVDVSKFKNIVFSLTSEMFKLMRSPKAPKPVLSKKCFGCSLFEICLPSETEKMRKIFVKARFPKYSNKTNNK